MYQIRQCQTGGNVQICEKNGFSAQRYEVRYVSDGYYRITAEHSDKVLDVSNGSAASGTNVQQMDGMVQALSCGNLYQMARAAIISNPNWVQFWMYTMGPQ